MGDYSREAINQGTAIIRGEFAKTHENDFFFVHNMCTSIITGMRYGLR